MLKKIGVLKHLLIKIQKTIVLRILILEAQISRLSKKLILEHMIYKSKTDDLFV